VDRRRAPLPWVRSEGEVMANQKSKAKSGMEGRGSRTARWAQRHVLKKAARKQRRRDDRLALREDV
jgi:hypothetical protein